MPYKKTQLYHHARGMARNETQKEKIELVGDISELRQKKTTPRDYFS